MTQAIYRATIQSAVNQLLDKGADKARVAEMLVWIAFETESEAAYEAAQEI